MKIYASGSPTDVEYEDDGDGEYVVTYAEISVDVCDVILEALEENPNELINIFTEILRKEYVTVESVIVSPTKGRPSGRSNTNRLTPNPRFVKVDTSLNKTGIFYGSFTPNGEH